MHRISNYDVDKNNKKFNVGKSRIASQLVINEV